MVYEIKFDDKIALDFVNLRRAITLDRHICYKLFQQALYSCILNTV